MSAHAAAVRQTEENLMNAWPSLRTVMCDGWVFREAKGYTKRANSACALEARGAFAPTLDAAERFYAALGGRAVFRLSPLAGAEPDRILAERGYRTADETIVMTAALSDGLGPDDGVAIAPSCSETWEAGYAAAHGQDAAERAAHRAILARIAPLRTGFARVVVDGEAVAFGLGVVERDRLGLFDIVTAAHSRRRGAARKLVSALMAWGETQGAAAAWLSVIGDNDEAKPLYAQLGFRELYRYHYRVAAS